VSDKVVPLGRTARLYALIARERRVGVIFRRGPSNQVRLIRWTLGDDRFEPGQWLKARVHEQRCDLSPAGEFLCYFVTSYRNPYRTCATISRPTWTAISRPPYFTALALWPKGDSWGGGGLFASKIRLRLNHRPEPYHPNTEEMALADGFTLPKRFQVEPLWENAGWGEDDPIRRMRMERDGWFMVQAAHGQWQSQRAPVGIINDVTEIMAKPMNTRGGLLFTLQVVCHAHFERNGRRHVETGRVLGPDGAVLRELGRVDWADLDHNGDVLWAWAGKLWRLRRTKRVADFAETAPRLLADFNDMKFEAIAPPPSAQRW
jgi:hypothetical protein